MTAKPVPVEPPPHPLPALTTYELTRYRRELEHALAVASAPAAARGLQDQLAAVLAEQEDRAAITGRRPAGIGASAARTDLAR
jgi:hypothetical protein